MKKTTKFVALAVSAVMALTALMGCKSNNKKKLSNFAAEITKITTDAESKSDALEAKYKDAKTWTAEYEYALEDAKNDLEAAKKLTVLSAKADIARAEIDLEKAEASLNAVKAMAKESKPEDIWQAAYDAENKVEESYKSAGEALSKSMMESPFFWYSMTAKDNKKYIELETKVALLKLEQEEAEEKIDEKWNEKSWNVLEPDPSWKYQTAVEKAELELSYVTKVADLESKMTVIAAENAVEKAKKALEKSKKEEKRAVEAVKILEGVGGNEDKVSYEVYRLAKKKKSFDEANK